MRDKAESHRLYFVWTNIAKNHCREGGGRRRAPPLRGGAPRLSSEKYDSYVKACFRGSYHFVHSRSYSALTSHRPPQPQSVLEEEEQRTRNCNSPLIGAKPKHRRGRRGDRLRNKRSSTFFLRSKNNSDRGDEKRPRKKNVSIYRDIY